MRRRLVQTLILVYVMISTLVFLGLARVVQSAKRYIPQAEVPPKKPPEPADTGWRERNRRSKQKQCHDTRDGLSEKCLQDPRYCNNWVKSVRECRYWEKEYGALKVPSDE